MDIPLEVFLPHHLFCLVYNRFMASGLNHSSLMEGEGTETTKPCENLEIDHQDYLALLQKKVRAQKLHPPKHPRLLTRLNFTSEIAGTPPNSS